MLNLKPLISMEDGEIVSLGVARGLNKAYEKMADLIEDAIKPSHRIKVGYMHAGALEQIQTLKRIIENRLECIETFITELSPALMVHTGPGTSGLCYYPYSD
jgi:fatty acid-binding protein DegV